VRVSFFFFSPSTLFFVEKHVSYGVKPEYFPSMGKALISSIQETLGETHFTSETKDCWVEVYGALSYDMIRGQKLA
jgi:nitric oxide dioxygenase